MNQPQQHLAALARQPDDAIDLAGGALAISNLFQPELDPKAWLHELDALAVQAQSGLPKGAELLAQVAALNDFLFDHLGFAGNQDAFHDPRNSFLDHVIARRLGIPISLSVVYVEIANRIGIPAYGVGFPAHFLVRVGRGASALMLDVYSHGVALPETELDRRLSDLYGEGAVSVRRQPALLRPARKREILVRMLRNLIGIYRGRGEDVNRLAALTAALTLTPDLPNELLERGLLYRDLDYVPAAVADLRRFVEVSGDAAQIAAASAVIDELGAQGVRIH